MILLDPQAKLVIGHRGNRAHAPENTLVSLLEAVALGVDAVEFDLRVSVDGVLVVIHDATLDRTTSDSGPVAARTAAERPSRRSTRSSSRCRAICPASSNSRPAQRPNW
jgi:glycerophosphoryl diester phosphodiesterase